jgi:hypothetical protein
MARNSQDQHPIWGIRGFSEYVNARYIQTNVYNQGNRDSRSPIWYSYLQPSGNAWQNKRSAVHNRTKYRNFTHPGTARFPFRIGIFADIQAVNRNFPWSARMTYIFDCRQLGTGARWVAANGSADGTDASVVQGMMPVYTGTGLSIANNVRICHVSSQAHTDISPSGKVYIVETECSPHHGMFLMKVYTYTAPPYSFVSLPT